MIAVAREPKTNDGKGSANCPEAGNSRKIPYRDIGRIKAEERARARSFPGIVANYSRRASAIHCRPQLRFQNDGIADTDTVIRILAWPGRFIRLRLVENSGGLFATCQDSLRPSTNNTELMMFG